MFGALRAVIGLLIPFLDGVFCYTIFFSFFFVLDRNCIVCGWDVCRRLVLCKC